MSSPRDGYRDALARVAAAQADARRSGLPRIEGVHLEGPFLGDAPGAHPTDLLGTVDVDWLVDLLHSQPGLVRLVTIAPEADPELRATRALVERGVKRVARPLAVAPTSRRSPRRTPGATLVTHLFNGMGPLGHRAPGLPGRRARRRPPDAEPDRRLRARAPRVLCAWPRCASRRIMSPTRSVSASTTSGSRSRTATARPTSPTGRSPARRSPWTARCGTSQTLVGLPIGRSRWRPSPGAGARDRQLRGSGHRRPGRPRRARPLDPRSASPYGSRENPRTLGPDAGRRPVRHLRGRPARARGRDRARCGCSRRRASTVAFPEAQTCCGQPALQRGRAGGGDPARAPLPRRVRALRRRRRAIRFVRGHGAPLVRTPAART